MENKRLYRSRREHVIAGVCGGLGEFFGIDPTIIRLVWVILVFAAGLSLWVYLIAALIIPESPY